jgi:hypothetical protein
MIRIGRRAGAAVEFAMVAPFIVLLMLGTADLTNHIRAYFRIERVAAEVANIASQFDRLRQPDVVQLLDAGQLIAGDIEVTQLNGRTLISVVEGTAAGNRMIWQRATIGGPGGLFQSRIGLPNTIVTLPANMVIPIGQTVLIVEVFNRRTPWVLSRDLIGSSAPENLYAFYIVRPRSAQLSEAPT